MPPRVKITKSEIIETALMLVRKGGEGVLNARAVAKALDSSTQPVFSNFASMVELSGAVRERAYVEYLAFLEREARAGSYPKYKAFGMAYVRFAKEERELFKLLFMCDRGGEGLNPTQDFDDSVEMIMKGNGVKREVAELMHLEMWATVHGIATMIATSFLELDEELVSNILSDVYLGLQKRHTAVGENNG